MLAGAAKLYVLHLGARDSSQSQLMLPFSALADAAVFSVR